MTRGARAARGRRLYAGQANAGGLTGRGRNSSEKATIHGPGRAHLAEIRRMLAGAPSPFRGGRGGAGLLVSMDLPKGWAGPSAFRRRFFAV